MGEHFEKSTLGSCLKSAEDLSNLKQQELGEEDFEDATSLSASDACTQHEETFCEAESSLTFTESQPDDEPEDIPVVSLPHCRFYQGCPDDGSCTSGTRAASDDGGETGALLADSGSGSSGGQSTADDSFEEWSERALRAKPFDPSCGHDEPPPSQSPWSSAPPPGLSRERLAPPPYHGCVVPQSSSCCSPQGCCCHAYAQWGYQPQPAMYFYQSYYPTQPWDSYGAAQYGRRGPVGYIPVYQPPAVHSTPHQACVQPLKKHKGKDSGADKGGTDDQSERQTALMLRNLPDNFSREALVDFLDSVGFAGCFDFVYYPIRFSTNGGFGYAFVNFVSFYHTQRAWLKLDGYFLNYKVMQVRWAKRGDSNVRGLSAFIAQYRNSPIMHEDVPDRFKPALFLDGSRVPFPKPTETLTPPEGAPPVPPPPPGLVAPPSGNMSPARCKSPQRAAMSV